MCFLLEQMCFLLETVEIHVKGNVTVEGSGVQTL